MNEYKSQQRGSQADYERYLAGMDASMQQKVALTAAHVLTEGWLADMGMGSGTGSDALAGLYPSIRVTGVDINPEMVERAAAKYQRPNLDFRVGDIAERCFEPGSLDTIFNSSVLHHVTTFNGYDHQWAERALVHQVEQLKHGGCLIVRDFVRPLSRQVRLEVRKSLTGLLEKFSTEFRALNPPEQRGFPLQKLESEDGDWQAYVLDEVHAVEFVLRKDYQQDWETEVLEEYTYFTQSEFESVFHRCGLRILISAPLRNPWIVRNRFAGKFRIFDKGGALQEFPATNYLLVGERVESSQGVNWIEQAETALIHYLKFTHYKDRQSGQVRDMVRRPFTTLDVIPFFVQNGKVYVLARRSYPRPVLRLNSEVLDGSRSPSYVTEPIVVITDERPLAESVEAALQDWAGLAPESLLSFEFGSLTYPSPGGLCERVQAVFVEIVPVMTSHAKDRVRAVSAHQLLRSAQVGGLPDARLEMHCSELLSLLGLSPGSWIGASLELESVDDRSFTGEGDLPQLEARRKFLPSEAGSDFLHLGCRQFSEVSADDREVSTLTLEYVVPKSLSLQTVSVGLLKRVRGDVYLGVCNDDLPAAQCFSGNSGIWVVPAWRLPKGTLGTTNVQDFVESRIRTEHNLEVAEFLSLGGIYFPSSGVTPEAVSPYVCRVLSSLESSRGLTWVKLRSLLENFSELRDGHLKTIVLRASRALL